MTRATKAAAAADTLAPPAIEPEAYYRVEAASRFTFHRVEFGPLARTEVDGAFLIELLDAPESAGVASYARVDG